MSFFYRQKKKKKNTKKQAYSERLSVNLTAKAKIFFLTHSAWLQTQVLSIKLHFLPSYRSVD